MTGFIGRRPARRGGFSGLTDLTGIGLSGVCLVHCTLLPLAVSLSPVLLSGLAGDRDQTCSP